jgi:large subunit ribosomal protein L13
MKTFMPKAENIERKWYIVDAEGQTLGRLASEVAKVLSGKSKPIYTPHVDTGDHVIIINAEKIVVTGKKADQKLYRHYTGYIGGLKEISYKDLMIKKPEDILMHAIKGMLPKNKICRQMLKKLRIYKGSEHKHDAQQPEVLELKL